VYVSDTASGNQLRFNSITIDPGTESDAAASAQVYTQNATEELSATENWWGDASGPANAGGQVGDKVLYDPWLIVAPLRVKTVAPQAANFTIDAKTETSVEVVEQGVATPVVTVASFAENPAGELGTKSIGKWVDVLFSDDTNVDEAEIRVYYADKDAANLDKGSLRLYWWNGEKWTVCSRSGVDKVSGFVWARVDLKTNPSVAELHGTFFAVGTSKSGGFSWWLALLVIFILAVLLIAFRLFWVLVVKSERAV
jgi:hypothetical protein